MSKSICNAKQELGISLLLSQLNSNNSSINTFKVLVQIRTDVIKDSDGIAELRERGGIRNLVKLLNKPNVKILNVVLSILANCCLQEECRIDAVTHSVISPLINLLRNINEDNIQSRICRLVGNLGQSYKIAIKLHDANVVNALVNVLRTSRSPSTQQMAIRALRLLWNITKTHDQAMLKAGAVAAVATNLASEDSDVSNATIRALATFTRNCSCAAALQVKDDVVGYEKLVSKMSSSYAIQCLYNLSHVAISRIELIKANVVETIVEKLRSQMDSSLLTTLCLLCRESVGRARLRHTHQGLALMVKMLDSSSCRNHQARILNALNHFLFDEPSLKILVEEGLVTVLIKKLTYHISKNGILHNAEEKATLPSEDIITAGNVSPCSSGFSPRAMNNQAGSWSPISEERSPSPSETSSLVGAYSPLCISDEELETSPKQPEDEPMEEELEKSEGSASVIGNPLHEDVGEEASILDLLCHVAYMKNPVGAMADKNTISTLIDYIRLFRDPNIKARKILCSIAGNKHYYKKLLDDQMVLTVHERLCRPIHSSQCLQCERLAAQGSVVLEHVSTLAESGLGEGEMKYRLLKADESTKMMVSLTIPHVIRERLLLMKLLVEYKALSFLLDALNEKLNEAVPGLSALFKTLDIVNPQLSISMCSHCDVGSLRREGTLVFLLDDGSTVSANKTSLCNISPFFEAMFRGGFKESEQTNIRLCDISAACLTSFLRIADTYCECILPKDVPTLLELVVATDRFLVTELTEKILSIVMNNGLCYRNAHIVYSWAIENGFKFDIASDVAIKVVKYVLSGDMSPKQRLEVMTLILESKHRYEFVNDMVELIKSELGKRPIVRPRRESFYYPVYE